MQGFFPPDTVVCFKNNTPVTVEDFLDTTISQMKNCQLKPFQQSYPTARETTQSGDNTRSVTQTAAHGVEAGVSLALEHNPFSGNHLTVTTNSYNVVSGSHTSTQTYTVAFDGCTLANK